jgi:hypothetical protein
LHGHARLLPLGICPRRDEAAPAAAAWQHEQRNSTDIRQISGGFESRIAPLTGLDNGKLPSPPTALTKQRLDFLLGLLNSIRLRKRITGDLDVGISFVAASIVNA